MTVPAWTPLFARRWFYDCSYKIHSGLADMFLADPRVNATSEGIAPGQARYLHDAIKANATRAG